VTFEQYLTIPTVIDLKSEDKVEALKELSLVLFKALDVRKQKTIIEEILKREEASSTLLGRDWLCHRPVDQ
jgi:mannitol/fructose-specific phosphotransferase system IIA component (Ntr-type)